MALLRSLLVVASLALGSAGVQACEVDHFSFVWGTDASAGMHLRNAEACKFGIKIGRNSHMASIAVAQSPQHGTLTPVDPTHWTYHPARGFAGQDTIVVRATGDTSGGRFTHSGDTTITWMADVAP